MPNKTGCWGGHATENTRLGASVSLCPPLIAQDAPQPAKNPTRRPRKFDSHHPTSNAESVLIEFTFESDDEWLECD